MAEPTVTLYSKSGKQLTVQNTPQLVAAAKAKGWFELQPGAVPGGVPPVPKPVSQTDPRVMRGGTFMGRSLMPVGVANTGVDPLSQPETAATTATAMLPASFLGPEVGMLGRAILSSGAGMLGNMGARLAMGDKQKPAESAESGLLMGFLPELVGKILGWPAKRLLTGKVGRLPGGRLPEEFLTDPERTAADWAETHYDFRGPRKLLKDEIEAHATRDLVDIAGGPAPLDDLGSDVKETIKRIGAPAFKQIVDDMKGDLRVQTGGKMVDTAALKQEAFRLEQEAKKLSMSGKPRIGGLPTKLLTAEPSPKVMALYQDIRRMKDQVPFMEAFELRKRWIQAGKEPAELIGNEPKSAFSHTVKYLTEAMDRSLASDPAAMNSWQTFRNTYKEGAELLQDSVIKAMLEKHPEKIAEQLNGNDVTVAREIHQALVGYARENARRNPSLAANQAVAKGEQALKNFRSALLQSKLGQGGPFKLYDHLKDLGEPTLAILFNGDAEGRQILAQTKQIADGLHRMQQLQDSRTIPMAYQIRGIPDKVMNRILTNRRLAQLYLYGISGYMREVQNSTAQGIGRGVYNMTPNMAKYIAQVGRAWALAAETDEVWPGGGTNRTSDLLSKSPLYQRMTKPAPQPVGVKP